ncbi:MAG: deoxyribonuclease V [Sphingobacteriaceae bacterium]
MELTKYDTLSPAEAIAYQQELKKKINLHPLTGDIKTIAGADISFNKYDTKVYAGMVVFSYPELKFIRQVGTTAITHFPYVSGLLAFREIPALMKAWDLLEEKPDVLLLDGQGIAHPRRMGIAAHFGILVNTPTIGVGKSRLFGRFEEPDQEAGSQTPLMDREEQLGVVLRSKKNCKPLFISPGHRLSIEQSTAIVRNCITKYRIPEPTRRAHIWVNELRIQDLNPDAQTSLF